MPLTQDQSAINKQAPYASPPATDARDRLNTAVEFLRREWRDGFRAGLSYRTALSSVRRLRGAATNERANADLLRLIAELEAYEALPSEQRGAALKAIADGLKRLTPAPWPGQI